MVIEDFQGTPVYIDFDKLVAARLVSIVTPDKDEEGTAEERASQILYYTLFVLFGGVEVYVHFNKSQFNRIWELLKDEHGKRW